MASGPITSWEIDGETVETVVYFIFLGSKVTAEALFIIAKTWKQPRCPSADEMDKEAVVHIHHGILLSH